MNYVEHHFGDYAKDTAHLSMLEHGAYRMLMDLYYVREVPLPIALDDCYRLVRACKPAERKAVGIVLSEFFENTDKGWVHKRCEVEIARYRDKQQKARKSAKARWDFEDDLLSERNANALPTQCEGNAPSNQTPVTSNQEKENNIRGKNGYSTPEMPGVSPEIWRDFKALRAKKRAPITPTAMSGIRREAKKAGISLEAALAVACERGWQGFKAEWVAADKGIDYDELIATAKARENAH